VEVEIRKLDGTEIEFVLSGVKPAFANAIRRAAIRDVPVMAIDEVEFKKNDSAMYDEILAHRLSMIPLKTPLSGYVLASECKCAGEGCASCQVELKVKAEGPTTVMSGDFKSSDSEVKPISGSVPIVKLLERQELELTAIARLGFGRDHAKWQSAIAVYKYMPVVEIDLKKCTKCKKCIEACPKKILEVSEDKLIVKDLEACSMCKACIEACPDDAIKVSGDPTRFIFRVESAGGLPPEEIVLRAVDSLKDKFGEFSKLVKKL
jgi:DNA-directed RNA polymerase subunit D